MSITKEDLLEFRKKFANQKAQNLIGAHQYDGAIHFANMLLNKLEQTEAAAEKHMLAELDAKGAA